MIKTVGNVLFKKMASHLVAYESGLSKFQLDCLLKRSQMMFLKYAKVLPSDEYINQHKPLVCGLL